jgi:hypothetical protein
MDAFYSERARCHTNSEASVAMPMPTQIGRPAFQNTKLNAKKCGAFQPAGGACVKISRRARESHAIKRPCAREKLIYTDHVSQPLLDRDGRNL